jgi:hypothetical protein
MASESPPASRRRVSTRSKEKSTEWVEHSEVASKKKYESRTHILENKMQEWDELLNDDLWDSFRTEFVEWIDENFKLASITIQKKLRTFLRSRDVWVMKSSKLIIAKSFAQVVKKDTLTSWTEEEIRESLKSETFVSHVINHLLQTNFDRDSKNYSWRTSSSRSESRHSGSSKSSSRERSVQENVKILKTVTMWIQIYTYRSANWSMILQSSLLFFYITSISWRFESHQVILWFHFFCHRDHIVWLISLSSIDFSSSIDSVNFRENHVILVILELSYSRIVNDSLNLIRRTR